MSRNDIKHKIFSDITGLDLRKAYLVKQSLLGMQYDMFYVACKKNGQRKPFNLGIFYYINRDAIHYAPIMERRMLKVFRTKNKGKFKRDSILRKYVEKRFLTEIRKKKEHEGKE